MAHFAELDSNNVVLRVVVVGNDVATAAGPLGANDMHVDGETWCVNFFKGGTWKQTSYNNNFRKQYASRGFTYNPTQNVFIKPQPFSSWSLDGNNDWQAPITYPTVTEEGDITYYIYWNETAYQADNSTGWETTKSNDTSENPTIYKWNGTTWIS